MSTALTETRFFETSIDLSEHIRKQVVTLLNQRLADATDLKTQTKFAHWNVKGVQFFQLHELFDQIAEHFDDYADLLAERATALGGTAQGTLRQAAASSSIPEYDITATNGPEHVRALARNVAAFGEYVREAIDKSDEVGDKSTADVFTEISRQVDKDLWFLQAHLQAYLSQLRKKALSAARGDGRFAVPAGALS
ncbi:MAG TPA: DNA starvation/stationary phase protection protein Dps [Terriglobales bacterium]|nr:DNA starvation/stationary phase protection protein Dps [Terriglobales bacterium]